MRLTLGGSAQAFLTILGQDSLIFPLFCYLDIIDNQ